MKRREFLKAGITTVVAANCNPTTGQSAEGADHAGTNLSNIACDVFVYGSTPSGVAAAVEASRRGCQVVLACPKNNPGGMAASGLCTTDAVRRRLFGGLVREFIFKVREHYLELFEHDPENLRLVEDGWHYEPSVAERVMRDILTAERERLRWLPGYWLSAVTSKQDLITEVRLECPDGSQLAVSARTFIDCTYEGDLASRADVPYRVGREGRDEYGESLAGIHYRSLKTGQQLQTPDTGEPSIAIQAFCARSIMTDDPEHRIPVEKPDTYEQHLQDFLPLLRDIEAGHVRSAHDALHGARIPRRKLQLNGKIKAMTSINCPGVSWAYPEAGREQRQKLDEFHRDHVAGMIYFLQHDKRIPSDIAKQAQRLGLHDQEFVDNQHWPWQLYVRQGRRIEGREIVTQHNFIVDPKTGRTPRVRQPIALGEYSFDVHPCHDRRFAVEGLMEGVLSSYPRRKHEWIARPGQIPFGAMLPKTLDNLLVPVAMSSTHVGMSVLRMEPVWMTTGQIAGLAAATAKDTGMNVAQIDPVPLPKILKLQTEPG